MNNKYLSDILNGRKKLYSSEEQKIGVTDEGTQIYRKTIYTIMTYFNKQSSGYQDATISAGVKIKKLLGINCVIQKNDGTVNYGLPFSSTGNSLGIWFNKMSDNVSATTLHFFNNVEWGSDYKLVTTIDYTK